MPFGGRLDLSAAGLLAVALASIPDGSVPVEQEPNHKTIFKNEYVQAFRVNLEVGETTLMHTHTRDDAAVRLSTATVAAEAPGEPLGPPESVYPGFVSARNNEPTPHTHRVHNMGSTLFDVIDVQVLRRPEGPAAPPISAPAAENAKMRLYRYELEPGAASAQHTHARPYLLVAATDVELRRTSPDGASSARSLKAGEREWVNTAVTHALMNQGQQKAILVEFELK